MGNVEKHFNNENENINENIDYKWKQNDGIKNICKKIDFNNEEKNENNIYIIESASLISDIMKAHQNSKKFNYNMQKINMDFNDFINMCSFKNDENQNIENMTNNIHSSGNNKINQINQINFNININKSFPKYYPNNRDKYVTLSNGQKKLNKDLISCTCKNSSCLKFYCDCFAHGKCCINCSCMNCQNIPEYESIRQEKYKNIIERNPKAAYQINSVKKSFTCNCKNSNCQKKYCDCFHSGKSCTTKCKCINCLNKVSNTKNSNNKGGKRKYTRRIRGIKNNKIYDDIYLTPKRKRRNKNYEDKNQSTAPVTESYVNNLSNKKNIVFNSASNKNKFKEVSEKLKLEMNEQK